MSNLIQEILRGNPRAISKAISIVENEREYAQELIKSIFPYSGKSLILGITGAPGSGKSSLVDQLIPLLREDGKKIGVIAVDPSSPFSGGAILGDRVRMMRHSVDPEVFIRSMATRGHLGGLARATAEAIIILEASGKDFILLETVGAGQDEVEIARLTDLTLVILIPGAGDEIQAFKAGIMEIADIFVLNKADLPLAMSTETQLKAMLELSFEKERIPPIVKTVATEGRGIKLLLEEVEKFLKKDYLLQREEKKKNFALWMLKEIMIEKTHHEITSLIDNREMEKLIMGISRRECDPYTVADELMKRMKKS